MIERRANRRTGDHMRHVTAFCFTVIVALACVLVSVPAAQAVTTPSSPSSPPESRWVSDVEFEQASAPEATRFVAYRLTTLSDGGVVFTTTDGGKCLTAIDLVSARVGLSNCRESASQKFIIVPVDSTPSGGAEQAREDQYFRLVSPSRGTCVTGGRGGLNIVRTDAFALPTLAACALDDAGQLFRAHNDSPNPDGVYNRWQALLNVAVATATIACEIDVTQCSVSPSSTPDAWFRPDDPSLAAKGVLSVRSYGCGDPSIVDGRLSSPRYTNSTRDAQTITVGGQVAVSNTTSSTTTFGETTSIAGTTGVKDVWGTTFTKTFSYEDQTVVGSSLTQTVTSTAQSLVRPGDSLMAVWSGNVFTISGQWRFAEAFKADGVGGALRWAVPVSSSYPVKVANQVLATVRTITSAQPKNCDAVDGATLDPGSGPVIIAGNGACDASPTPAESVSPKQTVTVCPGSWTLPGGTGSSEKDFRYQWFVYASDGDPGQDIPGATGRTFTVRDSTYSAARPFLGARVVEVGDVNRLESTPATAPGVAITVSDGDGDPAPWGPFNIVGAVDEGTTGVPYDGSIVDDPSVAAEGGRNVTVTGLPPGLAADASGRLSGTPTRPGEYRADVAIREGETVIDRGTVSFDVYDPATEFVADRSIEVVEATPESIPLVLTVPTGMGLTTQGQLPPGMTLSAETGVLSGAPDAVGEWTFRVADPDAPDTGGTFSLTVMPRVPTFAGALAEGRVGSAYSASAVALPGTASVFALAEDSPALPGGLELDANSGALTGTPSEAATVELRLVDLAAPGYVYSSDVTILPAVDAPPSAEPSPPAEAAPYPSAHDDVVVAGQSRGDLPATGLASTQWGWVTALGTLLGVAGIALMVASRLRRGPTHR